LDDTADIKTFVLSDGFIGIRDLTVVTAVPLPTALPLFASGIAALSWIRGRRKRHRQKALILSDCFSKTDRFKLR
jgi:hypothetical protein